MYNIFARKYIEIFRRSTKIKKIYNIIPDAPCVTWVVIKTFTIPKINFECFYIQVFKRNYF